MSFPTYPAYKDSGVEWLGDVPEHWYSARFSRVVMAIKDGTHGTFERVDEGVPLLSAKNVQNGFLDISEGESLISEDDSRSIVSNGFPSAGDLLLTIVGTIGRSCVYKADKPYAFQRSVCFLRFYKRYSPYFFYYFSQSKFFQEQLAGRSKSSAQAGVYMGDVVATSVVFPPDLSEQTQIARFLGHETARIDALIEEQQRLIELLNEKRQAVISHAVTKGLDPTVPMKDAGVEWLGEVPAHWAITKVKYLCYVNDGNHGEEYPKGDDFTTEDNGVPFIRGGNLENYTVSDSDMLFITPEKNRSMRKGRLITGDILFVNRGEIGKLALVPSAHAGSNLNSQIAYLRLTSPEFSNEFLMYYLDGEGVKSLIASSKEGSVLTQFPIGDLNSIYVAAPPKSEQEKIVTFLVQRVDGFDELISEATTGVELLKERRSALISAAVTGKIDVRGWQPPASSQAPELVKEAL